MALELVRLLRDGHLRVGTLGPGHLLVTHIHLDGDSVTQTHARRGVAGSPAAALVAAHLDRVRAALGRVTRNLTLIHLGLAGSVSLIPALGFLSTLEGEIDARHWGAAAYTTASFVAAHVGSRRYLPGLLVRLLGRAV